MTTDNNARALDCARRTVRTLVALATFSVATFWGSGSMAQDAASQREAVLVGAGDVARCFRKPALETEAAKTARLIERIPSTVFVAGDLIYENGWEEEFRNCYDPTWGRFKARTLPVPGNHDYYAPKAAPYYAYWGSAAGQPGKGYYSVQLGSWRVIGLNSKIEADAGSEQEPWLRTELVTHPAHCTLASGITRCSVPAGPMFNTRRGRCGTSIAPSMRWARTS